MSWINPKPHRDLNLEDYEGINVPNWIDADPGPNVIALAEKNNPFHKIVTRLVPPTGRYNCHGLVFASRRTNIDGPTLPVVIDDLIIRDRFRVISIEPRVGDIIVYRNKSTGKVEHTGFVNRIDKIDKKPIVYVWSKWGGLGEYEHQEIFCMEYDYCSIEYWRLYQ